MNNKNCFRNENLKVEIFFDETNGPISDEIRQKSIQEIEASAPPIKSVISSGILGIIVERKDWIRQVVMVKLPDPESSSSD